MGDLRIVVLPAGSFRYVWLARDGRRLLKGRIGLKNSESQSHSILLLWGRPCTYGWRPTRFAGGGGWLRDDLKATRTPGYRSSAGLR